MEFFNNIGPRPSIKHSIDRFPNKDGNYEPGNVRWATDVEQGRNRSNNRLLSLKGTTLPVSEWAEITGFSPYTIHSRIRMGWNDERILTTQPKSKDQGFRRNLAERRNVA